MADVTWRRTTLGAADGPCPPAADARRRRARRQLALARPRGGGAACGAAVKADAYGLGAREAVKRLQAAGCRDFFVATWAEAEALMPWPGDLELSVLHGVRPARHGGRRRIAGAAGAQQPGAGRALARDRPALRRDGRYRHQPARPRARRRRVGPARRPQDRDADEPPRLRRRGRAANDAQRQAFAELAGKVTREAPEPRQQRRNLPRRRLCLRPDPARASRSMAACRAARPRAISARSPGRGADRPAPADRGRATASATARTFTAERPARAGDPQSRLCRRLSVRLLGHGPRADRRRLRAGGRARVDGSHRDSASTRRRTWPKATGSSSTTICRPPRPSPGSANMSC